MRNAVSSSFVRTSLVVVSLVCGSSALAQPGGQLPPPQTPPQNPASEAKRALGKILFWDEQLSSDNTVACGTCHAPNASGADLRPALHPGADGAFGGPDDVRGSLGMRRSDSALFFEPEEVFWLDQQVTRRTTQSILMSAYSPTNFWDGRATGRFVDPETGAVAILNGGALESQAVGPVVSDVEMGHAERNWGEVAHKLRHERPMGLAADIPPDIAGVLASNPTYPQLFRDAFGDSAITARRIAFAIATYERTLVPNDTPFDRTQAGQPGGLTQGQIQGRNFFVNSPCSICHTPPTFTNSAFFNLGLRPWQEDEGRMEVTGDFNDRGQFRTPTLRNVGLKPHFMHTGQLTSLPQVLDFYGNINGQQQFTDGRTPLLPVPVPPQVRPALLDFLANGLTDARVRDGLFPFDAPALAADRPELAPQFLGAGVAGSLGLAPSIVVGGPGAIGNDEFRIGVDGALPGAAAQLAVSTSPPVGGTLAPDELLPAQLVGDDGFATARWAMPTDPAREGTDLYFQWRITDAGAPGGMALSPTARLTLFCGACSTLCIEDIDGDGAVGFADLNLVLTQYGQNGLNLQADLDGDADVDFADLNRLLSAFNGGCL